MLKLYLWFNDLSSGKTMLIAYKQKLYHASKHKHISKLLRFYGICYNHGMAWHKRYEGSTRNT
ncbi:hypothetical protein [Helicobacter felistomachi]|uniref:hypothetical protein n=1 Tax=Helicobacter felistomachi TaxID=3040201 RepID=UPI003EB83F6F